MDDKDRLRFIHDLFEFNDEAPAENLLYRFRKSNIAVGQRYNGALEGGRPSRKLLVNILAFCLMPNHYHLLPVFNTPSACGGVNQDDKM